MFRSIAAPALAAVISFAAVSEAGGSCSWTGGACNVGGHGSGPRGRAYDYLGSVTH